MDKSWAIIELQQFLQTTDRVPHRNDPESGVVVFGTYQRGSRTEAAQRAHVAEQILDRVLPSWRETPLDAKEWRGLRDWASRAIAAIEREQELEEKLGGVAPSVSTAAMHPWVWQPARRLWQNGHFRAALHAAASSVNSQAQAKANRFDLSEKSLFEQLLSLEKSSPGKPRLRVIPPGDSPEYRSQQEGTMKLAVGLFQVIRNSAAHSTEEVGETEALERLAALSMLARLLDGADVET